MAASFEILAHKSRTNDFTIELKDADGAVVNIAVSDVVRFKVFKREGTTPVMDIDEVAPTALGSVVTRVTSTPAVVTVRLAQGDLELIHSATYRGECGVVDDSETAPADAIKPASIGLVNIVGSGGGDIGIT